jgi:hypothetical protein
MPVKAASSYNGVVRQRCPTPTLEEQMLHIDIPTLTEFKALAAMRGDACVSLYLPASPFPHQARANRVAFKDIAKTALAQLHEAGFDKRRLAALEQRFDHLAGADEDNVQDQDHIRKLQNRKPSEVDAFWINQTNGLGVLATPETLRTFRLPFAPKPLAEVANRFHLTPLIRVMTSPHDVFVLALSEESVRLAHVFANLAAIEIKVPNLPHTAEEATRRPSIHVRAPRGHLQNLEGEKVLLQKYARQVNQAVCAALAGQATPLVLAAAQPIASIFRSVSCYPRLLDEGIQDAGHMSIAQLADAALPILNRLHGRELKAIIARYDELKPRRATTDISYASHAVTAGALEELLVDLDAVVPGLVSDYDGSVTYATSDDAETYSVVDEIARRAVCSGAHVLGARRDELPDRASLIAILRYQFGTIAG